jgi:hypothetical protein
MDVLGLLFGRHKRSRTDLGEGMEHYYVWIVLHSYHSSRRLMAKAKQTSKPQFYTRQHARAYCRKHYHRAWESRHFIYILASLLPRPKSNWAGIEGYEGLDWGSHYRNPYLPNLTGSRGRSLKADTRENSCKFGDVYTSKDEGYYNCE